MATTLAPYVIDPAPQASLPVADPAHPGARFPVRRIWCVGRNYAAHAREMGHSGREDPFFFAKPADALVPDNSTFDFPAATGDLHHEIELVVALGAGGRDLTPRAAAAAVWGHAVGLDMTRRDLQAEAKRQGRPWEMAKAFDASAPCTALVPATDGPLTRGTIRLAVNGAERQRGDLADMIWPVAEAIAFLSRLVALRAGDLIFTGTPEGVGPVRPGDRLEGHIDGLPPLRVAYR